jgi:hypothetical protein
MADEDEIPKAGGVKAMLAALNKKNADSHVVLPDGTVPSAAGKRPWKPPSRKDAPASGGAGPSMAPNSSPAGTVESSPAIKPAPPESGGRGGPPPPGGRGGPGGSGTLPYACIKLRTEERAPLRSGSLTS